MIFPSSLPTPTPSFFLPSSSSPFLPSLFPSSLPPSLPWRSQHSSRTSLCQTLVTATVTSLARAALLEATLMPAFLCTSGQGGGGRCVGTDGGQAEGLCARCPLSLGVERRSSVCAAGTGPEVRECWNRSHGCPGARLQDTGSGYVARGICTIPGPLPTLPGIFSGYNYGFRPLGSS